MGKTAAELMAELAKNKEYLAKKSARDEEVENFERICASDEKQLVSELNESGFSVKSVWDFVNSKHDYLDAVAVLLKHLQIEHHPKILAGIARSLAIPALSINEQLWQVLVELYGKTPSDSAIDKPQERGAQEAIAVALETLATSSRSKSLEEVVKNNPHGDGVQWLHDKLEEIQ